MTDDEIVYLIHAHYATSGEIFDVIIFARAIEHCTLTKQKARWYQEGVEAGLRQALAEPPNSATNVVEPYNGWILRKVYFEDGEPLMHSEPESQELAEPPNSATDVVEPEEPLCYLQEIDTLGGAYEQVAWGEGFPVYTAPQNMEAEIKRLQELYGKTEQLEAENKRLQELADYRLKLLTKMPSEWVSLTDEDMEGMFLNAEGIRIARYIETRLKEKNNA